MIIKWSNFINRLCLLFSEMYFLLWFLRKKNAVRYMGSSNVNPLWRILLTSKRSYCRYGNKVTFFKLLYSFERLSSQVSLFVFFMQMIPILYTVKVKETITRYQNILWATGNKRNEKNGKPSLLVSRIYSKVTTGR